MDEQQMTDEELARRVVYAFLYNTARLADRFAGARPMKASGRALQMAWFHALRRKGLKMREIAARLGISPATAATLARRLKANFLEAEGQGEVERRIEFMLWAGPLSAARIAQALGDVSASEVDAAIGRLLAADRLQAHPGRTVRYSARRSSRVVRDQMLARLDGLNQLVGAIAQAAWSRFFSPDEPAFARVLQFRARPDDLARLRALYEEHIWPLLQQIDADAADHPDAVPLEFVVTWSRYGLFDGEE